ncbi:eukaryotic translation initiation factor 2-alpha kinase 1-like isoform X2 [Scylla paramamosain]|uniref:eukaryotic translation initiation factor 2-alpha kinase 1-like isoform X2 n=1 Tax=Scylla paramamosain TaxID=85552 RepID=UPI0030839C5F
MNAHAFSAPGTSSGRIRDIRSLAEPIAALIDNRSSRDIILFLQAASKDVREQVFWGLCLQMFDLFRQQQPTLQSPWIRILLSRQWPIPKRDFGAYQATTRYQEEYEELEELGHGGFGRVVRARKKLEKVDYAIKVVKMDDMNESSLEECVPEVRTLATLDHPHVVRYYTAWLQLERWAGATLRELDSDSSGDYTEDSSSDDSVCADPPSGQGGTIPDDDIVVFQDTGPGEAAAQPPSGKHTPGLKRSQTNGQPHSSLLPYQPHPVPPLREVLYIQMKLYGKSLRKWMDDRNVSDSLVVESVCLKIFRQVLEAVCYIHHRGYIHRDIKPANILFTLEGNDVLLGDFGLARLIAHPPSASSPSGLSSAKYTLNVGTPVYAAPEVKEGNYGEKSDMYSLGIILLELFMVLKTDCERSIVIRNLKENGDLDPDWTKRWHSIAEWIKRLVDKDPAKRPSAKELLESSLFPQPEPPPSSPVAAGVLPVPTLTLTAQGVDAAAASVEFSRSQLMSVTSIETNRITAVESVNNHAVRLEVRSSKDEEIASLKKENAILKEQNDDLTRELEALKRNLRDCKIGDAVQTNED